MLVWELSQGVLREGTWGHETGKREGENSFLTGQASGHQGALESQRDLPTEEDGGH